MIYIVEDDDSIRELITYTLNSQNMEARSFPRPSEFYEALKQELPSLVLLDIMLPEEDGLSILKKLKAGKETKGLPVIMLTAKGSEFDTVMGLDSGADDYVSKPFRMMELLSRIRALLRRTGEQAQNINTEEYTLDNLYVCPSRHIVTVNGENVSLTLKEFELLCLLLEHREMVFSRAQLLDKVWGYSFDGESRTVDVHIKNLRQMLGEAGVLIETVRGVGYKIGGEKK